MKTIVSSLRNWTRKRSLAGFSELAGVLMLACSVGLTARAQSPGPGGALNLDGASGYAQAPNGVWFNGDFTVEGWVFVRSYNYWSRLMDFGNGADTHNVYLALSAGTGGFPAMGVFTNFGLPVLHAASPLPLGQWTHLAATLSGTTGTIYINGVNVGSGTLNLPPNIVRTNNYIGRSNYATDGYANAMFDEVRIWNVARTQGQIQANMHRSLVGNESGLAGYWRLDETTGTTLTDASGHGQTATLFGGSTLIHSGAPMMAGAGAALDFNAAAFQTASISNSAALNAYPLTVMTWFRAPSTSVGGAMVNKYSAGSYNGYQIFLSGGHLQAWYMRDTVNNVYSNGGPMDGGAVNDNLWHHAALVVDASGGKLYLDGVQKDARTWSGTAGPPTTTLPISLGIYQGDSFWTGQLGEVSVWNTALSAAQIQAAMRPPLAGNEAGLLGYWPMNEGGGTNINDVSGHGNTGALFNKPTRVASGASLVVADPGYCLSLTGNNGTNSEYVQVPNGVWFSNDFTVEGWVYVRSYNNWSRLIDFGNAPFLQEVYLALSEGTNGYPKMGVFTAGNNNLVGSSQQLPLNQWTHLAATLSGSTATILINGNPVGSGQVLVPGNFVRTNNFIGRSLFGTDAYANAIFDEVRIWNVARSATQIQQTMNRSLTGGEAGLLAYYRLDEGTGTNTVDATGNGMTATLINAPAWQVANEPLATFVVYSLGTTALLEGPGAGSDSVSLAPTPSGANWTATANASWLHLTVANQSGAGSTNVVFSYDSNPGATRTGTLTIGGQTVTVTQAGAAYVAARPVTTVVSSGVLYPNGLAVDASGNLYIADSGNNAIREWIPASNTLTTLLDGGLNYPSGVAPDGAGNVYIADKQNHLIKKLIVASNTAPILVSSGLSYPNGVAVDRWGNVYIADSNHHVVKKWSVSDGNVTTLIASGLYNPSCLAVDVAGNIYIADTGNHAIKKWNAANGSLTPLVSSGLNFPYGVAIDGSGNVYIADSFNQAVRKWVAANNTVITFPGWGGTIYPGIAVDGTGNMYVSDQINGLINEQPYVFVDPTSKFEGTNSGTDVLPTVLPAAANMTGAFRPTSDQPWLTIGTITNGVVSFSFTANASASRTAHITLFGVSVTVTQAGIVTPPFLTGARMLGNGAFQFSFTNNPAGSFTVVTTTNVSLPLSQWSVAGVPTNIAPGVFQFTSGPTANEPRRFYSVRSP